MILKNKDLCVRCLFFNELEEAASCERSRTRCIAFVTDSGVGGGRDFGTIRCIYSFTLYYATDRLFRALVS